MRNSWVAFLKTEKCSKEMEWRETRIIGFRLVGANTKKHISKKITCKEVSKMIMPNYGFEYWTKCNCWEKPSFPLREEKRSIIKLSVLRVRDFSCNFKKKNLIINNLLVIVGNAYVVIYTKICPLIIFKLLY